MTACDIVFNGASKVVLENISKTQHCNVVLLPGNEVLFQALFVVVSGVLGL